MEKGLVTDNLSVVQHSFGCDVFLRYIFNKLVIGIVSRVGCRSVIVVDLYTQKSPKVGTGSLRESILPLLFFVG